jgi:hypothetical protein
MSTMVGLLLMPANYGDRVLLSDPQLQMVGVQDQNVAQVTALDNDIGGRCFAAKLIAQRTRGE